MCETRRNNWLEAQDLPIDSDTALFLLNLYRGRIGQKQSWRAVQRSIARIEHQYAFLVTGQKLANWNNPKRSTLLEPRAFEAVSCFIRTDEFQNVVPEAKNYVNQSGRTIEAGALITELSEIYQPEETERVLFKALEGMWCDRESLVYLYVHKVEGHSFAVAHLCQKIHVGYKSALGFPIRDYVDFFASGYLYFENETHSKNIEAYKDNPLSIGQIEKFDSDSEMVRIGVSGKELRLKLWSRRNRFEVDFEASCHCRLRDDGYEPCADGSMYVSSFFSFLFKSKGSDEIYRFDRANYVSADRVLWSAAVVQDVELLKEKFDRNKWSVLPNVDP